MILAAGEGTRLRPLTFTRPKPLIPLGREPAIYHILSQLKHEGFDEVVMVVGHMRDQIMDYVGDGSRLGLQVSYAIKPEEFRCGTAGSLKLIEHLLDDTFLVAQSDTISELPLREAMNFHQKSGAHATVILTRVKDPSAFGVAILDANDRITEFQEKPSQKEAKSNLVSTGFYMLEPDALDYIENETFDFASDLFPRLLKLRKMLSGFVSNAFWVDIGTLEGYLKGVSWELDQMARSRPSNLTVGGPTNPVIMENNIRLGRQVRITGPVYIESGAIIEDGVRICPYSVIKKDALISQGAVLERSVIHERVTVGRECKIISSVIGQSAILHANITIEGSSIGPGSIIGDKVNILDGSRIWPNVQILEAETVNGTVIVPLDKAFYFYTALGQYTGMMASTGTGFIDALGIVPIESIEFHTKRRDFEKWVRGVLIADELAHDMQALRRTAVTGEELRTDLIELARQWADKIACPKTDTTQERNQILLLQV